MDVACSLSRSNVLYGGEVAGCRALEQSNLTTRLKYKCFHRKSFGNSRIFSKTNSLKKLKKITTYCVSSGSTRSFNRGNFWCWCHSGSSLYECGNLIKFSKHVGLPQCQGSESVAYLDENGSETEVIETGESESSLESNASGVTGEEGVQPSLDELRESLQKALKELEVARLSSTMFEEKAQKISEAAIALKDEATNAWDDVNAALSNIQDIINEENIAKEVVQKATTALSLAEARLNMAVDSQKIANEKNGSPKSSKESDSEFDNEGEESSEEKTLMVAQQDVKECQDHLENCEAELRRVQSRKEELQKEVDLLNVVAEQAQTKANKAEEDVANIMLLAEQAVAYELEAAQCADEADIALQRAEKNLALSSIESLDSAIEGTINIEMSQGSDADGVDKDWELPAEVAELLEPLSDGQPEESSLSYESDKENGKPTGELLSDNEADEEKLKSIQSRIQEMQKESTRETSPLSAPKALLKKSSRFFSASFFSFTADEEEFTPGSVFLGLAEFATKQLPKLVFGSLLVGAGYAQYCIGQLQCILSKNKLLI